MTYRERRQRKMERLEDWADKRDEKSASSMKRASELLGDPSGQPILIGHHSEKASRRRIAKIDSAFLQARGHREKSEAMRTRAVNIAGQLERSIYNDDPDAIEQLKGRIADLEAERDAIKAYNASCRKGASDSNLLPHEHKEHLETWKTSGMGAHGELPTYVLSNLSGNINRNKKRLAALERKQNGGQ